MKKLIILLILIVLVSILGLHLYYNVYKHGYEDKKYDFLILDTRGWNIIDPREGVYLSFGSIKDNEILSYAGVSPINKSNLKIDPASIEKLCKENMAKYKGNDFTISEVNINNLQGYVCKWEAKGINTDDMLTISEFVLQNSPGKEFDYILSFSFPKNNESEKKKAELLLNSFEAK